MARTFVFHLLRFLLAKFPFMANFPFRECSCCFCCFAVCCLLFVVCCLLFTVCLCIWFWLWFLLLLCTWPHCLAPTAFWSGPVLTNVCHCWLGPSKSRSIVDSFDFDFCCGKIYIHTHIYIYTYTLTVDGTNANGKSWLKWTACGTRWDARSVQYKTYKRWIGKQLTAYLFRENPETQLV